jgi:hypothetical protein
VLGATRGAVGTVGLRDVGVVVRLAGLGLLAALGLAMDVGLGGLRLPTIHRQVNEEWMSRYRGPIFGAGFGFQLGSGVVTIVTTSAIYLTLAGELLSGNVASGALIGSVFGLARALPILTVVTVRDPARLPRVQVALSRWRDPVRRTTYALQSAFAVAAGVASITVLR